MFELIKSIEVDRKNSLPVADLHARYRATGTPVVFGDLTQHWPATDKWNADYLAANIGDVQVQVFSNVDSINGGRPSIPVLNSSLRVYLEDLLNQKNDLRVSKLPLKLVPEMEHDFLYPRLGFDFSQSLTSLCIAGADTVEPIRQSSSVVHTVRCNFGEPTTVLLIPPIQTPFMYKVGASQNSIRRIAFDEPDFDAYPALRNLSGYVARLQHGDALYVPAGFWYCTAYQGPSITLTFDSLMGGFTQYSGAIGKFLMNRFTSVLPFKDQRLARSERNILAQTNARVQKYKT